MICICESGTFRIDGICNKCPEYSIYNNRTSRCDCVQGYVLNNGKCIIKTRPPLPETPLPIQPSPCGANMNYVNLQCICKTGYHLIGGICIACEAGKFFDASLGICRIPCQANEVYNINFERCDCAKGAFRIDGACTTCPGNTTYNPTSQKCVCPDGYRNQGNYCVVGCGVNEILLNGKCCCKTGYYPVEGICSQCLWN